ncbi:hypothetical protein BE21_46260 [Sorangium cellulosum]|uniref:SbsA Ig-like domain-containing protein n=1 Tax=Sorangium cellulosum TaxID=56 RepID=A0A150TIK6_SORCE|nr:hypothetical protein BE21_46260 [Sorangium cellulosum]
MKLGTCLTLATALAVLTAGGPASACDPVDTSVSEGFLRAAAPGEPAMVPRNVAIVIWGELPELSHLLVEEATGAAVAGAGSDVPVAPPGYSVIRPAETLAPDTTYRLRLRPSVERLVRTSDVVDGTPPSAPVLAGGDVEFHANEPACGYGSCPDMTTLTFDLAAPSEDDHTPAEALVYAVYVGFSPEQALAKSQPDAWLEGDAMFLYVDEDHVGRNVYIAVSAIDEAGNESERSEVLQVEREASGCAFSRSSTPKAGLALLLLAALAPLRRAGRRGDRGSVARDGR